MSRSRLAFVCVWTFFALTAGNFVYQFLTDHVWASAVERSYFQAAALLWLNVFAAITGDSE